MKLTGFTDEAASDLAGQIKNNQSIGLGLFICSNDRWHKYS